MQNTSKNQIRIYLLRHGKTKGNAEHRYVGQGTDEPLSREGIEELNQKLTNDDLCADQMLLFVSPMLRTRQTAEILFPDKAAIPVQEFLETNFGEFEYRNYEELNGNPDYQAWIDGGGIGAFPKGESVEQMRARVATGMKEVVATCQRKGVKTAVIVAHGGTLMSIMSNATGENYFEFMVKNGEGFCLDLEVNLENEIYVISYHRISCRVSA